MMTHAYHEIYLSNAQSALGSAFDYAINTCKIPGNDFIKLFLASSVSKRMERGEPACLAGKSGIELAMDIVIETKGQELRIEQQTNFNRSAEYWIGWAVAYYQWYSARTYSDIFNVLSFDDVEAKMKEHFPETNLKRFRTIYGCTQAELSERSGVSLRSIQMYEQRNKNINKASADTVYSLAKVLGCTIEDLMER